MLRRMGLVPLAVVLCLAAAQQLSAQFPTLTTTFADNNGLSGNMFNITAGGADVYIAGMDLNIAGTSTETWELYTTATTYVGKETTAGSWTLVTSGTVTAQDAGNPTGIGFSTPLMIPSGTTVGVHITLQSQNIRYTNLTGTATVTGADMTLTLGAGTNYPYASSVANRAWNGTLYYTTATSPVGDPEINVVSGGSTRFPTNTQDVGVHTAGTPFNETWTIENTSSSSALAVTSISCAPSGVANCTVTASPLLTPTSPVAVSSTADFDVTITALSEGPFEFTITIVNGDTTGPEASYTIVVTGSAGMSGTYLVSNDAGESPDFADLGAAFDALESSGMVGGVTIEVSEGTGPYTSSASYCLGGNGLGGTSYVEEKVNGLSITSQLVIRNQTGERPVIQGDAVEYPFGGGTGTLLFVETSFVTFQGFEVSGGHEWAIGMWDNLGVSGGTRNWTVRNCIAHNTQGNGIWCYSNSGFGVDFVTIENNFVYDVAIGNSFLFNLAPANPTLLGMGGIGFGPLGTNTIVRHNTIVINSGQPSTTPAINHGAISVGSDSGNGATNSGPAFQELSYNIVVTTSTGVVPLDMPNRSIPTSCNYNIYYNSASAFTRIDNAGTTPASPQDLAGWQFATSQEAQSVNTNPQLMNITVGSENLHLSGTSTNAIDAAVGSSSVSDDIDGDSRPFGGTADIGADESTGGTPTLSITASSPNASEPSTNGAFNLTMTPAPSTGLTVNFSLAGSTASLTAGVDFTLSTPTTGASVTYAGGNTGTITWPSGASSVIITVTVVDDSSPESAETVSMTTSSGTGYILSATTNAVVTIADDDGGATPVVTVTSSGSPAELGQVTGTFTLTATPAPSSNITVNITYASGTATLGSDFLTTSSTTVTITTSGTATVTITPVDDTTGEATETVILTVQAGVGYTVGSPSSATLSIIDDDGGAPTPSVGGGGGGGGGGCVAMRDESSWLLVLALLAMAGVAARMRLRRE